MTHFRPYRNADSPALAKLWNRGTPESSVARPLSVHEFDSHLVGGPCFDAAGLTVAERGGQIMGFAHAGFGPDLPVGRPLRLSRGLGTTAMLVVDPREADDELENGLLAAAERYLRAAGAKVLYAGCQYPLNPFYWGVYGGSECAGILASHTAFLRAVERAGYEQVSKTVLYEADLTVPENRDARAVLFRRQTLLEVTDDALPRNWWDNLATGEFRPTHYRLVSRSDQTELARASTWEMAWFGRLDGRTRLGLIDLEVNTDHRRKGYGRHLVNEILRQARTQGTSAVAVQTAAGNTPANHLYECVGFFPMESAILYRYPSGA